MKQIVLILIILFPMIIFGKENTGVSLSDSKLISSLTGGLIGGILGVFGTLWTSFYGPKKLIEFQDNRKENKLNGPRKKLLLSLLEDTSFPEGRTIETLSMVTGTTFEECRRLLIEIGARGIKHKNDKEGWVLIEKKPIIEK